MKVEFENGKLARNPIGVPVEICGLQTCTLQRHGVRKGSHGYRIWQKIISI